MEQQTSIGGDNQDVDLVEEVLEEMNQNLDTKCKKNQPYCFFFSKKKNRSHSCLCR